MESSIVSTLTRPCEFKGTMVCLIILDASIVVKRIQLILIQPSDQWIAIRYLRQKSFRFLTYQVDYYNLDVIISVGYRVKSKRGICDTCV